MIRHAQAIDGKDDALRPLSKRGEAQIRVMSRNLRRTGILRAEEFWHSPLVRSRNTAKLLARQLWKSAKVLELAGLLPNDDPSIMAKRLRGIRKPIAVVGHEPHLSALASLLVAGITSPPIFVFKKCAVMALTRNRGRWILCWQVSPEIVQRRKG